MRAFVLDGIPAMDKFPLMEWRLILKRWYVQACEMFIFDMCLRAWHYAEEECRTTLKTDDVAAGLRSAGMYEFLVSFPLSVFCPLASSSITHYFEQS